MSQDPDTQGEQPAGHTEQPEEKRKASSPRLIRALVWVLIVVCVGTFLLWLPGWVSGRREAAKQRAVAGEQRKLTAKIRPVVDKFCEMDSRLTVGLNRAAYSEKLGDLQVALDRYGRLPGAKEHPAYMHLQHALTLYKGGGRSWDRKVEAAVKDWSEVESMHEKLMQEEWSTAREYLRDAVNACKSDVWSTRK